MNKSLQELSNMTHGMIETLPMYKSVICVSVYIIKFVKINIH